MCKHAVFISAATRNKTYKKHPQAPLLQTHFFALSLQANRLKASSRLAISYLSPSIFSEHSCQDFILTPPFKTAVSKWPVASLLSHPVISFQLLSYSTHLSQLCEPPIPSASTLSWFSSCLPGCPSQSPLLITPWLPEPYTCAVPGFCPWPLVILASLTPLGTSSDCPPSYGDSSQIYIHLSQDYSLNSRPIHPNANSTSPPGSPTGIQRPSHWLIKIDWDFKMSMISLESLWEQLRVMGGVLVLRITMRLS